jgi:hypothetical protein
MRTASNRIVPAALAASLLLGGRHRRLERPTRRRRTRYARPDCRGRSAPPARRALLGSGPLGLARGRLVLGEGPLCRRRRSGHAGAGRRSEAGCTLSRTCLGSRPLGLGRLAMELASGDLVPALNV